jgi:hypothetical protein
MKFVLSVCNGASEYVVSHGKHGAFMATETHNYLVTCAVICATVTFPVW